MNDRTPRPSTSGESGAPGPGSVIAYQMRQAGAALQAHVKRCRYCGEFAALCPDAVRLFILWRGKPPEEGFTLGGSAWLDGHPPGMTAELAAELAPGTAWRELEGKRPTPRGRRGRPLSGEQLDLPIA